MDKEIINKYSELYEIYRKTSKNHIIIEIERCILSNNTIQANTLINSLDDTEKLIERLEEKLEGKSVSKTIKMINKNKINNSFTSLKALSSLFTHCIIECEKGNTEYIYIAKKINSKINKMI